MPETENTKTRALKDHPQLSAFIDVLSRWKHYHLWLSNTFSEAIRQALIDGLLLQLSSDTPKTLQEVEWIYCDMNSLMHGFDTLIANVEKSEKLIVLAINQSTPALIRRLLAIPHCRLIVFAEKCPAEFSDFFVTLKVKSPTQAELLSILTSYRHELESIHQVIIPDETLASALSMASHYFSTESSVDEAFQLLDSAAARASSVDYQDAHKPVVTTTLLSQIVSHRTQIPVSHLHHNRYQAIQFNQALQKNIYGQDAAISLVSSILQQACMKLSRKNGPLCSFLLVGPPDVGKTEMAYAMAEHLFGSANALLHVNLCKSHYASFSDIKIMPSVYDNHSTTLLDAIRCTPYAIILLENINQAPAGTLDLFKDIFIQGYTTDMDGRIYDFRHAIIVMTTTIGSEKISHLMQAPHTHEAPKTVDLMQLVLNENLHEQSSNASHQHSPDELCEEIMPTLDAYFSPTLLQCFNVIPFVPLDYAALEKIMRLKLKALAKQLDAKFGIELNYAPEVVKFIAHEMLWRKPNAKSFERVLEQQLYACVSHEILAHSDDKNRPKRLLLQLSENGQLLKCMFMNGNEAGVYAL